MSLSSSTEKKARGGRIIVGINGNGLSEDDLEKLRGATETGWTPGMEREYLERVQHKATKHAKTLVTKAMHEAESIRGKAYEEGVQQGLNDCQAQLDAAVDQSAETLARALQSVEEGKKQLFEQQRKDLAQLVRLVIDKMLTVELDAQREQVMDGLLEQALDAIDSTRRLVVRIRPEDEEMMTALMERARENHPDLERWSLKLDQTLEAGGMVLESQEGVADNSIAGRLSIIEPLLDQLDAGRGDEA